MKKNRSFTAALMLMAVSLAGCAAQGAEQPAVTPTQTQTPAVTVAPTATPSPAPTGTPAPTREPMPVQVEGKALSQDARMMQGKTMLPLIETMERLGYKTRVSELSEDDGTRRVHTFTKETEKNVEISVSYLLTDNTVSDVSFVRDKLIVPVDRLLLFEDETVFAPANFFEEAAGVFVTSQGAQITVSETQPSPEEAAASLEAGAADELEKTAP